MISPSTEMVATCQGMNFPLACSAFFTAASMPPQHGTSIRTTVTLLISLFFSKLFRIVAGVELRAADQRHVVLDEPLVEIGAREGRAVGGDEQLCPVEIGRVYGDQFYLDRPLREP